MAVRPGFHQAINFTISDLHSAGQRGRRNFAGAECKSVGVMGALECEWAQPNEVALQSDHHSQKPLTHPVCHRVAASPPLPSQKG